MDWDRRDGLDPDADGYPDVLAAGVGFVTHLALFDDTDSDAGLDAQIHDLLERDRAYRGRRCYGFGGSKGPSTTPSGGSRGV